MILTPGHVPQCNVTRLDAWADQPTVQGSFEDGGNLQDRNRRTLDVSNRGSQWFESPPVRNDFKSQDSDRKAKGRLNLC